MSKECVGILELKAFSDQDELLNSWSIAPGTGMDEMAEHPEPVTGYFTLLASGFSSECFMVGNQIRLVVIRNSIDTIHDQFQVMMNSAIQLPPITQPGYYTARLDGVVMSPKAHFKLGDPPSIMFDLSVILGGAYESNTGLMRDVVRNGPGFPEFMPVWWYSTTSNSTLAPTSLTMDGAEAIVDWITVELRHPTNDVVLNLQPALVKRNGTVTMADGVSPLFVHAMAGYYRIVIGHRNHLSVMTTPLYLSEGSNIVDLTNNSIALYGDEPMMPLGDVRGMWPGNSFVQYDQTNIVSYTGPNNDRDAILQIIGGLVPTNTMVAAYSRCDLNLDGVVRYTGMGNDRDLILQTIGGSVPTSVRPETVPEAVW